MYSQSHEALRVISAQCRHNMNPAGSIYLPGGGLPSEELMIERAVGRVKPRLQKNATIGYCFQRSRAFIWKSKSNEELAMKWERRL